MCVCKEVDDFIKYKPIWVAHLSNNETIYQDDGREGENPSNSWLRLKHYVSSQSLYITSLLIRFCDHVETACHTSDEGYYFSVGVTHEYGDKTRMFYVVGSVHGENIRIIKWDVPCLIPMSEIYRKVDEVPQELLIWRNKDQTK